MADERWGEFIEADPKVFVQGLYEISDTQRQRLGTVRRLSDGREFVYAKCGGTAAVAGSIYQGAVTDPTNCANLAIAANANIGDRSITVTMGDTATANTANAYAEGWLYVSTANGAANAGVTYKIKNHAAIAANANGVFYLYDKIRNANLTTAMKVSLLKNKHKDVVIAPSPPTAGLVGVPQIAVTANYFAWFQKRGPCAVDTDGTIVVGDKCIQSASVDGAVSPTANGSETEATVGLVLQVNANDQFSLIDLMIP